MYKCSMSSRGDNRRDGADGGVELETFLGEWKDSMGNKVDVEWAKSGRNSRGELDVWLSKGRKPAIQLSVKARGNGRFQCGHFDLDTKESHSKKIVWLDSKSPGKTSVWERPGANGDDDRWNKSDWKGGDSWKDWKQDGGSKNWNSDQNGWQSNHDWSNKQDKSDHGWRKDSYNGDVNAERKSDSGSRGDAATQPPLMAPPPGPPPMMFPPPVPPTGGQPPFMPPPPGQPPFMPPPPSFPGAPQMQFPGQPQFPPAPQTQPPPFSKAPASQPPPPAAQHQASMPPNMTPPPPSFPYGSADHGTSQRGSTLPVEVFASNSFPERISSDDRPKDPRERPTTETSRNSEASARPSGNSIDDPIGNLVFDGGNLIFDSGNLICDGGNIVCDGGNLVFDGGEMVSGSNMHDDILNANIVCDGGDMWVAPTAQTTAPSSDNTRIAADSLRGDDRKKIPEPPVTTTANISHGNEEPQQSRDVHSPDSSDRRRRKSKESDRKRRRRRDSNSSSGSDRDRRRRRGGSRSRDRSRRR